LIKEEKDREGSRLSGPFFYLSENCSKSWIQQMLSTIPIKTFPKSEATKGSQNNLRAWMIEID